MKKYIAIVFALVMLLLMAGCQEQAVLEDLQVYQVDTPVQSLDIRINAADLSIRLSDRFSVESNLKYLSVSEKNGVLTIAEEARGPFTYTNAYLILYVPAETLFEDVKIATGAGRLTADTLHTNTLTLQLGAGDVQINTLTATQDADIEGGTGKITIANGSFYDLDLEMGVGELNMTAFLSGNSELTFGVGNADLTLLGSKADYRIDVEKGIGSVTVDGQTVSDRIHCGDGLHHVEIEGGVGNVNLTFQAANGS